MGVGNSWEDLGCDEASVHPGVVVPCHLALHTVAALARVLGEVPGDDSYSFLSPSGDLGIGLV